MATLSFKTAQEIIEDGKKHLKGLKEKEPKAYKNTMEESFLLGYLEAHYDALLKYTQAMHEEKQD